MVRDSAGVLIVENGSEDSGELGWRVIAAPIYELGRAAGNGPDVFGSIRRVIRLRTGAIAVADALAREVRIFDPDGKHVHTLGGEGPGPGEFSNLWWIAELPGDSIAALDNLNARVSVFGADGNFARSFSLPRYTGAVAPGIVGHLDDGTLAVRALTAAPSADTRARSTILIYTIDRNGRILIDEAGHLWLAHPWSRLLDGGRPEERREEWYVFDPRGRLLGHLVTPSGFRVHQIGYDFLLGVHTDSLGIDRVRMYRLERK